MTTSTTTPTTAIYQRYEFYTRAIFRTLRQWDEKLELEKDLLDILNREFPGARYSYQCDLISFEDKDDALVFVLKYGHIYGR